MTTKLETLLIGGTGKTGRRVATRLAARGVPTRIASRTTGSYFDWDNEATWASALESARAVYVTYYPDLALPGAAERIGKLARLAVTRGAERLVLLSGRGEHQVWPAERALREAGAAFTIVRSAFFCQNFSEGQFLESIRQGELAFPAGSVTEPFVDADDIADVVTAALTDPRHAGQIYDLTGPRLLSFAQVAQELAEVSGKPLRYTPITSEQYAASLAPYLPAPQIAFMIDLFEQLLDGHNSLLTDGMERALGRKPRDFRDYARDAAQAFR